MPLKFEDLHPKDMASGYYVTNETPELLRDMLLKQKGHVERAAGICSGGEVPFFVLLPAANEVIAIDHTYGALVVTAIKAAILEKLGPHGTMNLFTERTYEDFIKVVLDVKDAVPEIWRSHFSIDKQFSKEYNFNHFKREWFLAGIEILEIAHRNLHKLKLVHGDLSDLSKFGTFDCIYTSNAFGEHLNRDGMYPTVKAIEPALKADGVILHTSNLGANWKALSNSPGGRTTWRHAISQRLTVAAPAPLSV